MTNDEWKKVNTVQLTLRLNRTTDADIIKLLDETKPLAAQIKQILKKAAK